MGSHGISNGGVTWYLIYLVCVLVSVNVCVYVEEDLRRIFVTLNSSALNNKICLTL